MKFMKRITKKYLIPHKENNYQPHILAGRSVVMLSTVIVLLFFLPFFSARIFNTADFYATIVPKILVELANGDRNALALAPLSVNPTLESAARLKAADMAAKNYFAHTSPEGRTPWYWFSQAGYYFNYAGENLAVNFVDSGDVERAWMNSPGHRANILNEHFTEIGIATAQGIYQGRETIFVVQMFGRPATIAARPPAPAPTPITPPAPKPTPAPAPLPKPAPAPPEKQVVASENIEVIAENDKFIAVKNLDAPDTVNAPQGNTTAGSTDNTSLTLFETAVTRPHLIVYTLYGIIGALIFLSLMLTLFVEIEKRHPRHIAYAGFVLMLLAGSAYLMHTAQIFRVLVI